MAAEAVGYDALRRAGRGPRADGRLVGVGVSSFVERTGYASAKFLANRGSKFGAHESVTLRANRSGGLDLYTGVSTFGQSNETAFAQVCSEVHGIAYDRVRVHAGDTASSPLNTGAFASRTMIAAAGAIEQAAARLRDTTLRLAGHMLERGAGGARDRGGRRARPRRPHHDAAARRRARAGRSRARAARRAWSRGSRRARSSSPSAAAYAYGSAAAVVAVDPETGDFEIERFVMVHDSGRHVNPKVVDGQVQGALAQGFGAALSEELRYDPETGQLVNGSMLDYFAPTAADLPPFELHHTEVPSPVTPFGVRGVGESGTIPPGATVANAICDALADFGVDLTCLPLTPELVWRALQDARDGKREA